MSQQQMTASDRATYDERKKRRKLVAKNRRQRKLASVLFLGWFYLTIKGTLVFGLAFGGTYLASFYSKELADKLWQVFLLDTHFEHYLYLLIFLIFSWGVYFTYPFNVRNALCRAFPIIFDFE